MSDVIVVIQTHKAAGRRWGPGFTVQSDSDDGDCGLTSVSDQMSTLVTEKAIFPTFNQVQIESSFFTRMNFPSQLNQNRQEVLKYREKLQ